MSGERDRMTREVRVSSGFNLVVMWLREQTKSEHDDDDDLHHNAIWIIM